MADCAACKRSRRKETTTRGGERGLPGRQQNTCVGPAHSPPVGPNAAYIGGRRTHSGARARAVCAHRVVAVHACCGRRCPLVCHICRMLKITAAALLLATWVEASSHPPCHDPSCTKEPADSKVFQLNPDNFHRFVKKNPLTLMEFYAPWCGHCQVRHPPRARRRCPWGRPLRRTDRSRALQWQRCADPQRRKADAAETIGGAAEAVPLAHRLRVWLAIRAEPWAALPRRRGHPGGHGFARAGRPGQG